MESIKSIYKIGYGPSSSHTMGPGFAAEKFLEKNKDADYFEVILYGSLALTGKGHMTDAILKKVLGPSKTKITFNLEKTFSYHPNAMEFFAWKNNELKDKWQVFSVGGGELKEENEPRINQEISKYPHLKMEEILKYLKNNNMTIPEYVRKFDDNDLDIYLEDVLQNMENAIKRGIMTTGTLPGGLKVVRKAATFYTKYLKTKKENELLYAYALAASEENASGNIVVTAPTCGACAVVPGILFVQKELYNRTNKELINALMVGGLIANIIRSNASISGAEVGCQGEVGVACSMAAAMAVYLNGGDSQTIEYAAEIALEHHLGLTCDPIDGLVQIPCIERNAIAALTAINASEYAMIAGSKHSVTLDSVIEVMKETGKDLQDKYKETSTGGLALRNKQ